MYDLIKQLNPKVASFTLLVMFLETQPLKQITSVLLLTRINDTMMRVLWVVEAHTVLKDVDCYHVLTLNCA